MAEEKKTKGGRSGNRKNQTKAAVSKAAATTGALTADQETVASMLGGGKRYGRKPIDQELLWEAIARIAEGESLRSIARDKRMPSKGTLITYFYKSEDPEIKQSFQEAYDLAKQVRAEGWAEELVDIADRTPADSDEVQASKVRIDTRKWLIGKLLQQYGEKQKHEITGKDGGPVQSEQSVTFYLPSNGREAAVANKTDAIENDDQE